MTFLAGLAAKYGLTAAWAVFWKFIKPYITVRNVLIAIGSAVVLGMGVKLWFAERANDKLTRELAGARGTIVTLQNVNKHNSATIIDLQDAQARADEIQRQRVERETKVEKKATDFKKELNDAPAEDDGPIAPVLERALEWMPE